MRIFVTGATGVIGRRAVPLMLGAGHQVTASGRSAVRLEALERAGATTVAVDLFDRHAVRRAVAGHDAVVNLATHVPRGFAAFVPGAWRENDRIRSLGSALLVDEALAIGVRLFVQESFITYPDSGDRWITEEAAPHPARYNRTALDAEESAARFARAGGRGVALRFAFLYGAGDAFTHEVSTSVRRGWLPIVGRPDGFFSMLSHDDAASAVVAALGARSGVYNVVDDEPMTRRAIGDALARLLGCSRPKLLPPWVAKLGGSVGGMVARSLRVSNAKLRDTTGWAPVHPSVREGWLAEPPFQHSQ